jgi:serine/threonine protein kinase
VKAGDVIGGYRLLEDFRVVGAGLSEWTFAERAGREYFLKRFLSPTYPDDDAPGSPRTKARKRAQCAAFEAHHRGIKAALGPVTSYGGNLVATLDFFRDGAKYYKVTEKVEHTDLDIASISRFNFATKLVLLKTVAHSLKILHELGIVHSDLKASNVLVKRTELGYTTKLIDFDSSYMVGHPPPADEIVGTMNYYSPELVRYIQGEDIGKELSGASDIFSLGLIYTEYLTGAMPDFQDERSAALAVLNGAVLKVRSDILPSDIVDLVERMLLADSKARPLVSEVHASLLRFGSARTVAKAPRPPALPPTAAATNPTAARTLLRGKGVRIAQRSPSSRPAEAATDDLPDKTEFRFAESSLPGLVGKLLGSLGRRS